MSEEREKVLSLIREARDAGARLKPCCAVLGLDVRTVQRWRGSLHEGDQRRGPHSKPNKLSLEEREAILQVVTSTEYCGLSPNQIVPLLADKGIYLGSESTFYRVLHEEGLQKHRSNAKPTKSGPPKPLTAKGPNEVYSWDITYLRGPIRGQFFYLYAFIDVWSRKIVGHRVEEVEASDFSAELMGEICCTEGVGFGQVALHADNGAPMKGATMLATLQSLGVAASFSRPSVSNDNPYSEALFRTLKYRPGFPSKPFQTLDSARDWVAEFVHWYNHEHLHSAIRYVTPSDRHTGADVSILENRRWVYENARAKNPTRWSGQCRNWSPPEEVVLNRARAAA